MGKFMIRFKKGREPARTLNDLESFIGALGVEPIKLLEREVRSWGEFTYDELTAIIESGRYGDFIDWQGKYSGADFRA